MSYILDALRKADAQRERDPSRGIHAHPAPLGGSSARGGGPSPAVWGAAVVAVAVVAAGGWYAMRDRPANAPVTPVVIAPAPVMKPVPQPAPAQPAVPLAANEISPPPPQGTPMQGSGMQQRAVQAREAAFGVPPATAPVTARAAAPSAPAAPIAGLPPDAPRVASSGGVYSPDPAQRMLIVNGQVYNEGSEVAPGLVVDKIEARTAVLKFRGASYSVAY